MALPPEHARWLARFYAARIASWPFLAASGVHAVSLSVVVFPFAMLFLGPVLPDALVSPVRIGPAVTVGILIGMVAELIRSRITKGLRRDVGEPPADLWAITSPLDWIRQARARKAVKRRAVRDARASEAPVQGWIATGLRLYSFVLGVVILGGLVVGVSSGRILFS